jgi:hypothetical protein
VTARVYVAARFSDQGLGQLARLELEEAGITCTARWLDEDPKLGGNPANGRIFAEWDLHDICSSDYLLLLNPESQSKFGTGGCHFETGYAYAKGLTILVVGSRSNVFHQMLAVECFATVADAIRRIQGEV